MMQNASAQSLCIFCAFRLSGQQVVPATAARRRLLHSTRRHEQQSVAQSAASGPSNFIYDPNSSLTRDEQEFRARRREARRVQEEEQRAREEEAHRRQIEELQARQAARDRSRKARQQTLDQRESQSLFGQEQVPQRVVQKADARQRRQGQGSITSGPDGRQTGEYARPGARGQAGRHSQEALGRGQRPARQEARSDTRRNNQRPQAIPNFTSATSTDDHSAGAGFGRGSTGIKPVQHKSDEQIEEERRAAADQRHAAEEEAAARKRQSEKDKQEARERREREQQQAIFGDRTRQSAIPQDASTGRPRRAHPARPPPPPPPPRPVPEFNLNEQRSPAPLPWGRSALSQPSASPSPNDPGSGMEEEYHATPFKSGEYHTPVPEPALAEENTWQHLRKQKSAQAAAPPPPPPPASPQSAYTAYTPSRELDVDKIESDFGEHRRQRPQPPPNPNIQDAQQVLQQRDRSQLKCARCGQVGHHARQCPNPRKSQYDQQGARSRGPRNIFRKTQVDAGEGVGEGRFERDARQSKKNAVPDSPYAAPAYDAERQERRRPERSSREARSAYETEREEKPRSERPSREAQSWENAEEEPAEEAVDGRRARRGRRGFVDEEEEDVTTSKTPERRRDWRASKRRQSDEDADDEAMAAREERLARKAARKAQEKAEQDKTKAARAAGERAGGGTQVHLPEFVSVSNLAQQLGVGYEPFVQRLEQLGYDDVFPGKILNRETSGMIAMEYDFDPVYEAAGSGVKSEEEERDLKAAPEVEDTTFLPTRPPVVTIMGHVDHGKTTILDYLRRTSVAAGEAGGITQHIGAFSVPLSASGRTITFLDTPGHAAFLSMRQRGANVTDIVILVVAADDSVKPQTLESIRCAKEAGVPMIVAVNKIDKPEADVQRVKNDLSRHGVDIEDFGGEVQVVEVSGKTGQGLDALEENVVTLSEILDHRADTDGAVEGWVLEATTKRAGRVATVLVRRGTLRPGAVLVAGKTWARVRTLRDARDQNLAEAGPGTPVEVDGWRDQPIAGDEVLQAPGEQKAADVVDFRVEKGERAKMEEDMEAINEARRAEQARRKAAEKAARVAAAAEVVEGGEAAAPEPAEEAPQDSGQQTVPFIIKADVSGSAEAVAAYIPSLTSPLIAPDILNAGVGAINEGDIELAAAAGGHLVAFNLAPPTPEMRSLAASRGVRVLENDVIYRMLEQVREVLEERLPPVVTQRVVGEAEVGAVFEIGVGGRRKMRIAGCKVRNGVVGRGARVRVVRGGEKVYDGSITSLKNVKKDVAEMRKGSECGMGFEGWESFQEGDQIQTYEESSEKRRL